MRAPSTIRLALLGSAALAGALREGERDVGRVALPVERQVDARDNIIDIQMRIPILDLGRRDFLNFNPERPRHRRLAPAPGRCPAELPHPAGPLTPARGGASGRRAHPDKPHRTGRSTVSSVYSSYWCIQLWT